jgi:hypothetical protein
MAPPTWFLRDKKVVVTFWDAYRASAPTIGANAFVSNTFVLAWAT